MLFCRTSGAYDGYRYGLAGLAARTSGPNVREQKSALWRPGRLSGPDRRLVRTGLNSKQNATHTHTRARARVSSGRVCWWTWLDSCCCDAEVGWAQCLIFSHLLTDVGRKEYLFSLWQCAREGLYTWGQKFRLLRARDGLYTWWQKFRLPRHDVATVYRWAVQIYNITIFRCPVLWGCCLLKIIEIGWFLAKLLKKKRGLCWDAMCMLEHFEEEDEIAPVVIMKWMLMLMLLMQMMMVMMVISW